jgi:hypothetical protein
VIVMPTEQTRKWSVDSSLVSLAILGLAILELSKLLVVSFFAEQLQDASEGNGESWSSLVNSLTSRGGLQTACIFVVPIIGVMVWKELRIGSVRTRLLVNLVILAVSTLLTWAYLLNILLPVFRIFFTEMS